MCESCKPWKMSPFGPLTCKDCLGSGKVWTEFNHHHGGPEGEQVTCIHCDGHGLSKEGYRQKKWDLRFLELARVVASWSKDPSSKCGAVIVRPNLTVMSMGYNGHPQGMSDAPENYDDRSKKYSRVVHAEMNALLFSRDPLPLTGCTLYTTAPPCDRCVVHCIQAGLHRYVFSAPSKGQKERWNVAATMEYLKESSSVVVEVPADV